MARAEVGDGWFQDNFDTQKCVWNALHDGIPFSVNIAVYRDGSVVCRVAATETSFARVASGYCLRIDADTLITLRRPIRDAAGMHLSAHGFDSFRYHGKAEE